MAKIIQKINLEVAKPNLFQAVVAKQNDYGSRFLNVTFVNNGEKIEINPEYTATINAKRPDGASKRFDSIVNDDGTVTAPLTSWMLELTGLVTCDISVLTNEGKLTTTDFSIHVNIAACSDDDITIDEDYDILKDLIYQVETLEAEIEAKIANGEFKGEKGDKGDPGDGVGQETFNGGTIFNDYENNRAFGEFSMASGTKTKAGTKAFRINDMFARTTSYYALKISDYTGIEKDDVFSICSEKLGGSFNFCGSVVGVHSNMDGQYLLIDGFPDGLYPLDDQSEEYIWFYKPDEEGPIFKEDLNYDSYIGLSAHAEGYHTEALGDYSHAEGKSTKALGRYSHAEGKETQALHNECHAEGYQTRATQYQAHAEGRMTFASHVASHAEGTGTEASGNSSHSEGISTAAKGDYSHAEGQNTIALGVDAHAEGYYANAKGFGSHAEGGQTTASGNYSHAECGYTVASGDYSHAEGFGTNAKRGCSHAGGYQTIASGDAQYAIGKFNAENEQALFVVGNGDSDETRKNAFVVNADGSAILQTISTDPNAVVTYQQMVDYVAQMLENRGQANE